MVKSFHVLTNNPKGLKPNALFFGDIHLHSVYFISENENGRKVLDKSVFAGRPPESQITSHTALENTDGQRKLSSLNNEVVSFLRRRATMSPASLMELPLEEDLFLAVWGLFGISFAKSKHYTVSKISGRAPIISVFSITKIKLFFTGQKHICLPDAKNKLLLNVCIDCLYEKNLCLRVQLYNNETCSKNLRNFVKLVLYGKK